MGYYEKAKSVLKKEGYRMTNSRHDVLSMFDKSTKFLETEQIQQGASSRKMDKVTVYRILTLYEELGFIKKLYHLSGYVKLPIFEGKKTEMAIFIDEKTKEARVEVLMEQSDGSIKKTLGFVAQKSHVEYLGSFDFSGDDVSSSDVSVSLPDLPDLSGKSLVHFYEKDDSIVSLSPPVLSSPDVGDADVDVFESVEESSSVLEEIKNADVEVSIHDEKSKMRNDFKAF